MSAAPRRRRRSQHAVPLHTRGEVAVAVAGSAAVVLGTALLIWLMRPGPSFSVGTGGILHRQPRAGWLIVLTLAALASVAWFAVRPGSRVRRRTFVASSAGSGVLAVAVATAVLWPHGLIHHYIPAPTFPSIPSSSVPSSVRSSSSTPASGPTSAPPGTTAPASSTPTTASTPTTPTT